MTGHLTTVFGEEASAFVRRRQGGPWFLYLAFNAPHTPHEPTPERLAKFAGIDRPVRQKYAAQVSLMDDAIGMVMTSLEETRQTRRTLVFFFSDNGGPVRSNGSDNGVLRGQKGDVYEGGVRVPFVVSWPGTLPEGTRFDPPVSSLDAFATALAVAQVNLPADKKYDGVNLIPHLTGRTKEPPRDRLYWRTGAGKKRAIRDGQWKLVRLESRADELYDLATDIGESKDLAGERPEIVARLAKSLEAWDKELIAPVFLGSSVKNEDWGPGGANQKSAAKADTAK